MYMYTVVGFDELYSFSINNYIVKKPSHVMKCQETKENKCELFKL